jgi:hypothetical protein
MKKIFGLLLILVVLGLLPLTSAHPTTGGDAIETIRSQYAAINKNVGRYKKVKRNLPGYSAEGGTMDAFFDGKSLKKIVAHFYGEMGRTDEEYYFWGDKLIFVFGRESNYDRPLSGKVVSKKENRFYFNDGQMIRWIDENGRQVSSSDSSYNEKQSDYLETSQKFAEMAR